LAFLIFYFLQTYETFKQSIWVEKYLLSFSPCYQVYFLAALAADLVTLPLASDFSTDLMTPTATV